MGTSCLSKKNNNLPKTIQQPKDPKEQENIRNQQLKLIFLLYDDLASRSETFKITYTTFIDFYHLNGLWGEQIFQAFNKQKSGLLGFEEFSEVLINLVKGNRQSKLKFLFEFYDIQHNQSIRYQQLLKMFYSYPKEQLKQLLKDSKFRQTLTVMRQSQLDKSLENLNEMERSIQDQLDQQNNLKLQHQSISFRDIQEPSKEVNVLSKSQSHVTDLTVRPKICNITWMIKRYIKFLFEELGLKITDSINFEQFKDLITRHQKLFDLYFQGFHSYIWEFDENSPVFQKEVPWIQGQLTQIIKQKKKSVYVKFIRNAFLIFNCKQDKIPIQIRCLEGLIIENCEDGIGFRLKHQDGHYLQTSFRCITKQEYNCWIRHLQNFIRPKIYEKYKILDKLGAGNYSVVYKCMRRSDEMLFALKQIKKARLTTQELDLINNQVNIISHCHHPNIIKFQEKFETKTHLYLVMEFVKDGDLFELLNEKKKLDQYTAAVIFQQLLFSIKYLNEQGLVHRDIKLQNIMVIKSEKDIEKIKIIDFGFALYIDTLPNLSDKEKYVGTPCYAAPQILTGVPTYDQKIDLFSCGVILYYLLSGQLPYDGETVSEVLYKMKQSRHDITSRRWKQISVQAKDLIKKLLLFNPKNRLSVNQALNHVWIRTKNQHIISK